ncbi:lachesin-like [Mytilus edulis]|uniref:lachesin-like n=1 Tax=Mytilus edulis TaxID=6550 RepID=UPI0039EDED91
MTQHTPFIINSTDYAEGFIGKSLHVNCEVKSVPKILDVTLQPKETIFNSDVSNISTGNHQTKFTFMITDPTLQDSGNYTCNATNVHTSSISDTIKLEIYGVHFQDQSDEHITFGERIIIDCAVESHPAITKSTEITWSLNGSCVNTKNIIKYKQPTPTSLTINNATFGDQGEYTCAVEKDMINGTSGGFWINVNGDFPNVNSNIIYNTVQDSAFISVNESADSILILTCSYESFPNATGLIWEKQNGDNKHPVSGKATGGTLDNPNITFTSVEKSDEGNYTCYVTNAVGKRAGNSVYIQVNESMCPCLCSFKQKLEFWKNKNFTKEEMLEYMAPFLKKTLEEMKLEQNKLSKNIRKRTSAKDDRTSSQQIGLVGIVFIAAAFGVIIVFDIIAIKRYLLNIREAFNRV